MKWGEPIFDHYPDFWMSWFDRFKSWFWRWFGAPLIAFVREFLIRLKIIHHKGRQGFLLGWLKEDVTVDDLRRHLIKYHFSNHFPSWKEEGELLDMRIRKNFHYQYHLRAYHDREVRGHYEYTPEYRPWKHITDQGMEDRFSEFMDLIGHLIVPHPNPSDLKDRGYSLLRNK